ncbi:SLBB domain-containing protein [Sphingomonas sp. Leaf412]|uniref:SLBB domain-containing protein n=1 Tax=Sphingomonas sp. Leaf412 TaxID=1736370 RepID=UPI000B151D7F|nr:SLBB domain-containing protein [Sphingomonas sp. Leaf412]
MEPIAIMVRVRMFTLPGLAATLLSTAAVAQQPRPTAPATPAAAAPAAVPPAPLADGYVLGTGDVVEVSVLGRAEFAARVQVQADGTIQLPYLRSVPAANMTVLQLRDDIRKRLQAGGFYTDPVVAVTVATYTSRYVTVLGQVSQPGLVPVDRAYRVSEILARVGGAQASAADAIQLRRADGSTLSLPIATIASGGPDQDPYVTPGDKLFLPEAPIFYISGAINGQGAYKVDREMTVRKALARAGGVTDRGSDKKVKVFRNGQEVKIGLDEPIMGGDSIKVGERFF